MSNFTKAQKQKVVEILTRTSMAVTIEALATNYNTTPQYLMEVMEEDGYLRCCCCGLWQNQMFIDEDSTCESCQMEN